MTDTTPQARDEAFIVKLHWTIQLPARDLLYRCRAEDLPTGIIQGLRTSAYQDDLWQQGRRGFCACSASSLAHPPMLACPRGSGGGLSKPEKTVTNARGGSSWHNFGLAFDVCFDADPGPRFVARWPNDVVAWARVGEIGKYLGLEWGGDWTRAKDGVDADRPHFQWRGIPRLTLADARAGKRPTAGPY